MGIESEAPEFVRGLIAGSRELGAALAVLAPDVIVLQSAHWVATFNWYVTAHETHSGICIADEAPDLIPGLPYRHRGDPEFARALAESVQGAGIPCGVNDAAEYRWDYATFVPLQYIDPEGSIPVVTVPTVICSDLKECQRVGGLVHETALRLSRRAVFIASTALSHKVVRGPELWPSEEMQAMDRRMIELLRGGQLQELEAWLPRFSEEAVAEMGGRPLGGMIGAMRAMADADGPLAGKQYGAYAQSSGSGNATVCVTPARGG